MSEETYNSKINFLNKSKLCLQTKLKHCEHNQIFNRTSCGRHITISIYNIKATTSVSISK